MGDVQEFIGLHIVTHFSRSQLWDVAVETTLLQSSAGMRYSF